MHRRAVRVANNGGCDSLVTCTNTPGSYSRGSCPSGFGALANGCTDIDECATGNGSCDPLTTCLGIGSTLLSSTPVQVGSATTWTMVDNGDASTCGIRAGAMFCWCVYGWWGGLGIRTTSSTNVPVQAGAATDWAFVLRGAYQGCGVRTTGPL
jgi:hypothetical protein